MTNVGQRQRFLPLILILCGYSTERDRTNNDNNPHRQATLLPSLQTSNAPFHCNLFSCHAQSEIIILTSPHLALTGHGSTQYLLSSLKMLRWDFYSLLTTNKMFTVCSAVRRASRLLILSTYCFKKTGNGQTCMGPFFLVFGKCGRV